jgi:hypothetical protein
MVNQHRLLLDDFVLIVDGTFAGHTVAIHLLGHLFAGF